MLLKFKFQSYFGNNILGQICYSNLSFNHIQNTPECYNHIQNTPECYNHIQITSECYNHILKIILLRSDRNDTQI